jgi:hypothetical protein
MSQYSCTDVTITTRASQAAGLGGFVVSGFRRRPISDNVIYSICIRLSEEDASSANRRWRRRRRQRRQQQQQQQQQQLLRQSAVCQSTRSKRMIRACERDRFDTKHTRSDAGDNNTRDDADVTAGVCAGSGDAATAAASAAAVATKAAKAMRLFRWTCAVRVHRDRRCACLVFNDYWGVSGAVRWHCLRLPPPDGVPKSTGTGRSAGWRPIKCSRYAPLVRIRMLWRPGETKRVRAYTEVMEYGVDGSRPLSHITVSGIAFNSLRQAVTFRRCRPAFAMSTRDRNRNAL